MARRSKPATRQGTRAPCTAAAPAGTSPCGLLALALWLCIAFAAGIACPGCFPCPAQAGFASASTPHAAQAARPLSLPRAGFEREAAGLPLLSAEAQCPPLPARLDAGRDSGKRHGQKDRDAFHGQAFAGARITAAAQASDFARLALPGSPCRQAWRCFALFALPPPPFHA